MPRPDYGGWYSSVLYVCVMLLRERNGIRELGKKSVGSFVDVGKRERSEF